MAGRSDAKRGERQPGPARIIAVCGAGACDAEAAALAEAVGREIARRGYWLACGGLGGVMEAAARGAKQAGGMTLGILPGLDKAEANPWIDVAVATGLAEGRNLVLVRTADAVIALPGEYGTLSEIALALKIGKPVIGLNTWKVGPEVIPARDAVEAVDKAAAACGSRSRRSS
jgi:hypothetical protein